MKELVAVDRYPWAAAVAVRLARRAGAPSGEPTARVARRARSRGGPATRFSARQLEPTGHGMAAPRQWALTQDEMKNCRWLRPELVIVIVQRFNSSRPS